jgi:two-component system, NtrC family, nitrogen regulation sensor histidine kinase NtrY
MVFKQFSAALIRRVLLLALSMFLGFFVYFNEGSDLFVSVFGLICIGMVFEIIRYTRYTNRKITRFLESIRYEDFATSFIADQKLGPSFKEMGEAFNEVIEVFKKTRAEKQEQMFFLQVVIQHINTGIISFDSKGRIGLINNAARQLLQITQFKNIQDLSKLSPQLLNDINSLHPGKRISFKASPGVHLIFQAANLKIGQENWTLLSFQNIKAELQSNELEAWQNLSKVLRHEIMNSITPISSLVDSLRTVLDEESFVSPDGFTITRDGFIDIQEGLETIAVRSQGLLNFVNAYREYTNIPKPQMALVDVKPLIDEVALLMKESLQKAEIKLVIENFPADMQILADKEQVQMILINLIKNSIEAFSENDEKGQIRIKAGNLGNKSKFIEVIDNGPGIVPEALDRIFIPFFSTKKTGSGIGLAISRQIMNQHQGNLQVFSVPHKETIFKLGFKSES